MFSKSTAPPVATQPATTPTELAAPQFGRWYFLVALVFLPLLVYGKSLSYGLLGLDDTIYFQNNILLHNGGLAGLRDLWTRPYFDDYAPISQMTIWLDLALRHEGSYALVRLHQLLWMGLCSLAVFQIMRRVSGYAGLAWAVALLYVLHPASAEASLWIAERKNLVSIALSLWSIERYIAWRQGAGRGALVASIMLCPLAILAKAHAVIIPAVITCYEVFLGTGSTARRALGVVPSGVLTLIFVVSTMSFVHLYHSVAGMQVGGSLAASVLCDGAILARYLMHVVLPHHLALFYCVIEDPHRWPELLGWWLLVLGVVAMSIALASERRLVMFAWCAAGCSILPVINLKPLPVPMADHYLQWSLPWLLLIVALVATRLIQSSRRLDWQVRARWITAGYALFFLLMSIARIPEFSSLASVGRTGVRNQGDCAINWGLYCNSQEYQSPPDLQEAGRAGILAYGCADYKRIFYADQSSCIIMGAIEARRLYGAEAANQLLAKALPLMNEQAQCFSKGMIFFMEERYQEATTVLNQLYSPSVKAAAHSIGQLCRSGDQQPWDFSPAIDPDDRQLLDPNRITQRNGFSFQAFCVLSSSFCRIGDAASGFDLAALLVNIDPSNADALSVYCDSSRQLGLQHSAEQARIRLLGISTGSTN